MNKNIVPAAVPGSEDTVMTNLEAQITYQKGQRIAMLAQGKVTTDHGLIQKWAEARRGYPAVIRKITDAGIDLVLSFVFPDIKPEDIARRLSWDEFFERFDKQRLVFVYDDDNPQPNPERDYTFY